MAETELHGLKTAVSMQAKAIEANALPWSAKNDKLESRYEQEALDATDRGQWQDVVDGLGR